MYTIALNLATVYPRDFLSSASISITVDIHLSPLVARVV